jgi:mRNA interferase RelE/StbE
VRKEIFRTERPNTNVQDAGRILEKVATVEMTPEAGQQEMRLPKEIQGRVRKAVKRLENWPAVSGIKRLTGNLAGWYRLRIGDYRMRFRVKNHLVTNDKIGHRKDVYED